MDAPFRRPVFVASVIYEDPAAALDWLAKAFGFERVMVIRDEGGTIVHAEMGFRGGLIHVGTEWADFTASPRKTGGRLGQYLHVMLDEDVDAHCERARAAGAEILREPEDQFYGDRIYQARDPEGHVWNFAEVKRAVSREEAEKASGLSIEGWS